MKRIAILSVLLILPLLCAGQSVKLQKNGNTTQLYLHGEPFIMLAGELANSSASSGEYMDSRNSWEYLRDCGLNTVLAPVYWELIEPEEGRFDFSSVDYLIDSARKNDLHLVLLWFGTWKNSMSCYVPSWVKKGFGKRFTLAKTTDGHTQEIISALDGNALKADCKAFASLMRHLKDRDASTGTVLMVQVENEIGMLGTAREGGSQVDRLFRKEGSDDSLSSQERFQGKLYARYAGAVAAAGKAEYDIPMYVNVALNSRGRKPGEYPSAGPLSHLMDIWKSEAPAIDLLSPDIYDDGFADWIAQYSKENNQLFIPEIRREKANAARVFYVLGRHAAIGFSPFSIDDGAQDTAPSYHLLEKFLPLIAQKQAQGKAYGVLVDKDSPESVVTINDVTFTCRHDGTISWSPAYGDKENWNEGAFLILDMGDDTYLFLGTACVATMKPSDGKGHIGIMSIDEVSDSSLERVRRLNGDEDHQGRHLRISYGDVGAQLLKVYRYE